MPAEQVAHMACVRQYINIIIRQVFRRRRHIPAVNTLTAKALIGAAAKDIVKQPKQYCHTLQIEGSGRVTPIIRQNYRPRRGDE